MYPIKLTWRSEIAPLLFTLASVALAVYLYANFPTLVPTHWNLAGEIDGWSSKLTASLLFPGLIMGVYILLLVVPLLDPKRERYAEFAKPFHIFKASILGLFLGLQVLVGLAGLGYNVPVGSIVPVGIGLLFIILGNYFGKIRMNWTMGIRTPWTLSSENVWNKTHRLGGKIFILAGPLFVLQPILPFMSILPVFISVILMMVFVPMIYSYLLFRKENRS